MNSFPMCPFKDSEDCFARIGKTLYCDILTNTEFKTKPKDCPFYKPNEQIARERGIPLDLWMEAKHERDKAEYYDEILY